MKLFTIRDHTRLGRLRGLDAIACCCSRCRLVCGCSAPDKAYTHVDSSLHFGAVAAHGRVPLNKVLEADLLITCDLAANNALSYIVELGAVGNHTRLSGLRCLHAIAR